jgi:hypothetical protein
MLMANSPSKASAAVITAVKVPTGRTLAQWILGALDESALITSTNEQGEAGSKEEPG